MAALVRIWLPALLALTGLRLAIAAALPLSPDEAYYWVWSRVLQPGYLDHPPMVAIWIRLGTIIAGQTALGVRLIGPVSAAFGSVIIADAASCLFPGRRAGIVAAVLLNATLLMGVGSVIMTPDTPLIFFWTLALWALARLAAGGRDGWWLVAGAATGLAMASKYTAALLPLAVLAWLLIVPSARRWWRRPAPYAGALAGLICFAPVVLWNAAHGWASFAKQGGREGDFHPGRAMQFLAELVAGQIGLATPILFAVLVLGVVRALRQGWHDAGAMLLAAVTILPACVFLQHAIGDRVQANWVCVLYPAAALAAAGYAPRHWRLAAASGFGLSLIVYAQALWHPIPLPGRLDVAAARLQGWEDLARQVEAARVQQGAGFVAADDYGLASELAWNKAGPAPVYGLAPRWRLFALPQTPPTGTGLVIAPARHAPPAFALTPSLVGALIRPMPGGGEQYRLYRTVLPGGVETAKLPGTRLGRTPP